MSGFPPIISIIIIINGLYGEYPNDEYYVAKQRHYFDAIRVPDIWQKLTEQHVKRSIQTIAIVDSGVNSNHPDLIANMATGYNVVDKSTDTRDREGHGTRMAGIAGAMINNTIGIAGITGHVKLLPIFDGGPLRDSYTAAAINYAVNVKADVILFAASQPMPFSDDAVAALERASKAGIQIICSAGNDASDISQPGNARWPCEYSKTMDVVLCVAATGSSSMELRYDSNYAPFIDVAAPGDVYTTSRDGGYTKDGGTSDATALLAGVVAMMKSVSTEPLSAKKVKSIIKQSSTPGVERDEEQMGFGRVNVLRAVELAWR